MLKQLPSTLLALIVSLSVLGQTSIYSNQDIAEPLPVTTPMKLKSKLSGHNHHNHEHVGEKCTQHTATEALMAANPQYREGVLAAKEQTRRIKEEIESGVRATPPVYTIPIVFHVIHKGENVGSGTNISDAQIQSCVDALNRDYRRTSADGGIAQGSGPDTEIQFCLAGVDPSGNPHSGINRVNGTSVSGYSSNGITSSNEASVKALSRWDNRYYLNVWVVSEINDNGADVANPSNFFGGTLGYAYLPTNPVTFNSDLDGIVIINLCVGNDPNQSNGYRLWPWGGLTNRAMTHEVGHSLGLSHTFSDSNPFSCLNGDGIGDTPNAQQININNCNDDGPCNQQIENYMDYTPEECQDQFTSGQTLEMRSVLTGARNALVNTSNCGSSSSNDYDAGISAILAPTGALCSTTFTPQVTLTNFGSTTLTSVQVAYAVDGQPQTPFNWTGSLSSGASISFTLPPVTTTAGNHTFTSNTVDGTLNSNNNDEDTSNDGSNSSFNVGSSGTQVTLTLDLDCYGSETTWEVRNASNQVEASGGPYTDTSPNGEQIVQSFCLTQGCYDFSIFDSYVPPDGMAGAQYTGCDVNGDYEITDGNTTLVQMTAVDANFGASATHNFCIGGGGNPGTPTCEVLAEFDGASFFVNPVDQASFNFQVIDNDQETVSTSLPAGFTSNWMGFFEEVSPGDTNFFVGATSWHEDNTAPSDNWLTFGPVTMLDDDGELRWKHQYVNNDFRDGYEVRIGTTGTDIADFNGITPVYSIIDNDPSTNGDLDWTQQSVSLPAGTYANQSLYFAFRHRALDQLLLYLDDIEVEGCTSLTVDLETQESEVNLNVFPNPSNGNFTYQFALNGADNVSFEMFDAMGRKVWEDASLGNRMGTGTISTDGMARGVYTLVVRGHYFNVSERLILTR